ncbi:MAG: pyridoxal-phosphate dependent enzyme, partial [Alphaproteobacteria bacterium]
LLAGLRAEGVEVPVHGACVRRVASMQRERIRTVADRLADLLACGQMISDADILTWDTALQPGYGRIGAPAREAIALMAEMAGLFVDPVYTAKSFAVLVDLVRSGRIGAGARVLFIHTGGTPAIFAYEPELRR